MDATRKSIFITGAASGIGRAAARLFADRGWYCGLYDVNREGLEALSSELGSDRSTWARLDVTRREDWRDAVQGFGAAAGGQMHVLFNNAGIASGGLFEDVPEEAAMGIIDVNLKGPVNGIYASLPLLKATPGAVVVNTASVAGMTGMPTMAVYSATKHAVRGLTEALSLDLGRYGIRVCDLMPWFIDTAILDGTVSGFGVRMRDALSARSETVYPVEMAAQALWEAVHGDALHLPVGGKARRMWWRSRWRTGKLRKELRAAVEAFARARNAVTGGN